MSMVSRSV